MCGSAVSALAPSSPPNDLSLSYAFRGSSVIIIAVEIWLRDVDLVVILPLGIPPWWRKSSRSWKRNRRQRWWPSLRHISCRRPILLFRRHISCQRLPVISIQTRLPSQEYWSARRSSSRRRRSINPFPLSLLLYGDALPSFSSNPSLRLISVVLICSSLVSIFLVTSWSSAFVDIVNRSFAHSLASAKADLAFKS